MKYLEQKAGHWWWTKNPRYFLYFLREFSGVLIALYLVGMTFFPHPYFHYLGLIGSLIHSVTWLSVMPQLLRWKPSKLQKNVIHILLLSAWLIISYLIFQYL